MGLTLCAKNLQGTIAMNYQAHCIKFGNNMPGVLTDHISSSANEVIFDNYNRHLIRGIPRGDKPFDYNVVGINEQTIDSGSFHIYQNYPNPVQSKTTLSFFIPTNGHINLEILNNNGQIVNKLVDKQITFGDHIIVLDCNEYPSGIYFCQIRYSGLNKTIKMLVLH